MEYAGLGRCGFIGVRVGVRGFVGDVGLVFVEEAVRGVVAGVAFEKRFDVHFYL